MKKFLSVVAISGLLVSVSACETLEPILAVLPGGGDLSLLERLEQTGGVVDQKVVANAVKALPIYCKLPLGAREKVREEVNKQPNAGGVKMGIHCPGDPPLTLQ